jgi:hypothetical protein
MTEESVQRDRTGFDRSAAVTRSLLGWGVVAGVFYLVIGIILGLTREGFDFSVHPLSILMLGEWGWLQRVNIILAGLMVIAAAIGMARAMTPSGGARWAGILIGVFGACMVLSGVFPPDPMAGFPPGGAPQLTVSGVLHFLFGAVGFLALAIATFVVASWFARTGKSAMAWGSRAAGVIIVVGFAGGAVLGVLGLWIAVVLIWVWLATASVVAYRSVPDPDRAAAR